MANLSPDETCILIADDNEANRQLLCSVLIAEGHKVICAEDGDQAVELIDKPRVNLGLLDVLMPDSALPQGMALATMHEEVNRGWWDKAILEEFEQTVIKDGPGGTARKRGIACCLTGE